MCSSDLELGRGKAMLARLPPVALRAALHLARGSPRTSTSPESARDARQAFGAAMITSDHSIHQPETARECHFKPLDNHRGIVSGQLRAADGVLRPAALDRGGVNHPHVIGPSTVSIASMRIS